MSDTNNQKSESSGDTKTKDAKILKVTNEQYTPKDYFDSTTGLGANSDYTM